MFDVTMATIWLLSMPQLSVEGSAAMPRIKRAAPARVAFDRAGPSGRVRKGEQKGDESSAEEFSPINWVGNARLRILLKPSPANVSIGGPDPHSPMVSPAEPPLKACGNDGLRIGDSLNAASCGDTTAIQFSLVLSAGV